MDVIFNIGFTLACLAGAIWFLSAAARDWKARPPKPAPVAKAPESAPVSGHPNGATGEMARALGWSLGIAVLLGTLAIVVIAVTDPRKTTAEQAALLKAQRRCPPIVSVPTRPIGYPADDVLGVRAAMTWTDAEETLKCVSEDYEIKRTTLANGVTGKGRQTRPIMKAVRGQETITVAFFGSPGQERAAGVWQEKFYDVGEGPARQSVEGELVAHYGTPHETRDPAVSQRVLTWSYDPDGKPLRVKPREGTASYLLDMAGYMATGFKVAACVKNAKVDPAETPTWDGRCGLTIRAELDNAMGDQRRLARWRIVVLDQQALARYATPLRAVAAPAAQK
ncbi:MAG: hypothetical protein IV086_08360 [Hyphomonadaceae bacterium]|nr:MAG: hypothetical protein FD160_615 [Caulobacteraceae bacterium]MBT9445695.1 hypothetical protein [Hyphomonadaceae bacterium]